MLTHSSSKIMRGSLIANLLYPRVTSLPALASSGGAAIDNIGSSVTRSRLVCRHDLPMISVIGIVWCRVVSCVCKLLLMLLLLLQHLLVDSVSLVVWYMIMAARTTILIFSITIDLCINRFSWSNLRYKDKFRYIAIAINPLCKLNNLVRPILGI